MPYSCNFTCILAAWDATIAKRLQCRERNALVHVEKDDFGGIEGLTIGGRSNVQTFKNLVVIVPLIVVFCCTERPGRLNARHSIDQNRNIPALGDICAAQICTVSICTCIDGPLRR